MAHEHHVTRFRFMNRTKVKVLDIAVAFIFSRGLPDGWGK